MTRGVDHIRGTTFHGRAGGIDNRFTYGIDYVLFDAEAELSATPLFARNRRALASVRDRDHGGPPGQGRGAAWVREVLAETPLAALVHRIELLAQPRVLGHVFNPVSFWLLRDRDDALRGVIAEVTNTFGDRHSYLTHRDDLAPITPQDRLVSRKCFHVSPFQRIAGLYHFTYLIDAERIAIRIEFADAPDGLVATLAGRRRPLTSRGLVAAMLRRPFGSRRVLALIHWQALRLWWKGGRYTARPAPPDHEVSRPATHGAVEESKGNRRVMSGAS